MTTAATSPVPGKPATESALTRSSVRQDSSDPGAPHLDVLVVGAGQAGLALAWHLNRAGVRYLLLDAAPEVGHSWRTRWDSLRLFTPSQYDSLPGTPFPAPADSHPTKDQVADYLASYAQTHQVPVQLNTPVDRLTRAGGRFVAETPHSRFTADQVVVATGAFHQPHIPALGVGFAADVLQMHSSGYRNPTQFPEHGQVLFWWLLKLGMMSKSADSRIAPRSRPRGHRHRH
jgi:putative flavoprotein involved in K+ transport